MSDNILESVAPVRGSLCMEKGAHGRFRGMRLMICGVLTAFALSVAPHRADATRKIEQDDASVTSYILKETGSSNVLMSRDVDKPVSPASLTKIMTSMMAIESGRLDEVVTIPKEATMVEPTRAGLKEGEKIRLRDLVKAAMVNSSNDAAFSIASHLGGSIDSFVTMMNVRARALGMTNTSFTNPAGYDKGIYAGNMSTARDLMILTERAIRNPEFNAIARLDKAVFTELGTGKTYCLKTHNKLLAIYPYTVGIKTGYTARAGRCLIARAIKDRKDLLMVMLDARTDRWSVAADMFDRGFDSNNREQLQPLESPRQDTGVVKAVPVNQQPVNQALVERERALAAIRLKLARQGDAGGSASGVVARRDIKEKSAPSVRVAKRIPAGSRVALTQKAKSQSGQRIALKAKKSRQERVAVKSKIGARQETRLAMKAAKKRSEVRVAMKSTRKAQPAVRTAMKTKRRNSPDAKSAKQRNARKEQLSMSGQQAVRPAKS